MNERSPDFKQEDMPHWQCFSHTNSSMIKRGTYPKNITQEELQNFVNGSFGGRFTYFGAGEFEFIAYTD
jgi:hypothetical protein